MRTVSLKFSSEVVAMVSLAENPAIKTKADKKSGRVKDDSRLNILPKLHWALLLSRDLGKFLRVGYILN